MKSIGLDKILGRLEDLDSVNLSILVQRLARDRNLQETVFNTIQDGILVIDFEGIIQYANDAACPIIGLKQNDIGQSKLWKMVPDLGRVLNDPIDEKNSKKASIFAREFEINYPEKRFIRIYMVPIDAAVNSDGSGGYVVVLTDITEAKLTIEEKIENERTSSIVRLAAGVAHELGNPLNSLTIHLQLIQKKLDSLIKSKVIDGVSKSIEICQNEVKRLDSIISNFLKAIRPEAPNLNELYLIKLLEEVLNVQEVELFNRKIDVKIDVKGEMPKILGDKDQIKQVFFNVIKNGMEAISDSGELKIYASFDEYNVNIQFTDNGVGISKDNLNKIFDPYFTTKDEGHGLGMMIVQRIMRDHGGSISIESQIDVGSVVTLQFPLQHLRTRMLNIKK